MTDQREQRRSWRSWLATGAAAAACVATPAVAVAVVSSDHHDAGHPATQAASESLTCPTTYDLSAPTWVPAGPRGIDGAAALAPIGPPSAVLVCAYLHADGSAAAHRTTVALSGSRPPRGNLSAVSTELGWAPRTVDGAERTCTFDYRATDADHYLLGLTYGGSTIWVSAPGNHCTGSSNGEFASDTNFGASAAAAYRTGTWPVPQTATRCYAPGVGRAGQETTLVPGHPTRLTLCSTVDGRTSGPLPTAVTPGLVAALNRLPTERQTAAGSQCSEGELPTSVTLQLRFGYDSGPDVVVDVAPHCTPAVHNGSLVATDASAVLPMIESLTR